MTWCAASVNVTRGDRALDSQGTSCGRAVVGSVGADEKVLELNPSLRLRLLAKFYG